MTSSTPLFKDYAAKHLRFHLEQLPESKRQRYLDAVSRSQQPKALVDERAVRSAKLKQVLIAASVLLMIGLIYGLTRSSLQAREQTDKGPADLVEDQKATLPVQPSLAEQHPPERTLEVRAKPRPTQPAEAETKDRSDKRWLGEKPQMRPQSHGNAALADVYAPFGLPAATHVFYRPGYAMGFSDQGGIACWVAYKTLIGNYESETHAVEDKELRGLGIAQLDSGSKREGYVRGAFIPASHLSGLRDQKSLSYFSLRALMARASNDLLNRSHIGLRKGERDIYVMVGSIKPRADEGQVLAQAFFRICYRAAGGRPEQIQGFIVPNRSDLEKNDNYRVSVNEIEAATGLDFFSQLPDQSFEARF